MGADVAIEKNILIPMRDGCRIAAESRLELSSSLTVNGAERYRRNWERSWHRP